MHNLPFLSKERGEKMKILYGTWGEITRNDGVEAWQNLGHPVKVAMLPPEYQNVKHPEWEAWRREIKEGYDAVFTFNFFPVLSDLCMEMQIPYLSWVYDSPHYTLFAKSVSNSCNRIFLFDREMYRQLKKQGIDTVYHEPLAVNTGRLHRQLEQSPGGCTGISFVGNLYRDSYNFWDQITYLPEELKGYVDGVICMQQLFCGYDLVEELLTREKLQRLSEYVKADLGEDFLECREQILKDMIRKKVTVEERYHLLKEAGELLQSQKEQLLLCCRENPGGIKAKHLGYVDYEKTMPKIFKESKINLNITLRSIRSGIPLRVMDVLGAGGFLLTNYQSEFSDYFVEGQELVWYESREEFLDKLFFYLPREAERKRIAAKGKERAEKQFSYEYRLQHLLQQL